MGCNCDINKVIRSCPPYANLHDVQEFLDLTANACCAGFLTTECLNPINNAEGAITEAFPEGINDCGCSFLLIQDARGLPYVSADNGETWYHLGDCIGRLTTPDLSPVTDREDAMTEAFGSCSLLEGNELPCEILWIIREDGGLCHSVDFGDTWSCEDDATIEFTNARASRTSAASTNSTSYVDVPDAVVTITTKGGPVLVGAHGFLTSVTTASNMTYSINGTDQLHTDGFAKTDAGQTDEFNFTDLVLGLSPGTHTFRLRYKTYSTGTASVVGSTAGNRSYATIWAVELG